MQAPIEPQPEKTAAPSADSNSEDASITPKSIVVNRGIEQPSSIAKSAPEKSTAAPLPQPVSEEQLLARAEQSRRRSAVIRYQAADGMIRAGDYGRAISTLELGDNSGDDPRTLANRYLLAIAFQGADRNDEWLDTLDKLRNALERKLRTLAVAAGGEDADDPSLVQNAVRLSAAENTQR